MFTVGDILTSSYKVMPIIKFRERVPRTSDYSDVQLGISVNINAPIVNHTLYSIGLCPSHIRNLF